jgi:ribosomal protein S18 acetylase RimI-like enzyme
MTLKSWILLAGLSTFQTILKAEAWSLSPLSRIGHRQATSSLFMTQQAAPDLSIDILVSEGDEKSLSQAATFMVDAFWLSTGRLLIPVQDDAQVSVLSDVTRKNLYEEQFSDLTTKYGERMGKRLLVSRLLTAIDKESGDILGVVGVETSLLDRVKEDILSQGKAETMLKDAVSTLGPKQRRLYKDSTVAEIAQDLLPDLQLVACLSNLSVSPNARRRGIAATLCAEAERVAASEWKFGSLFLKVESENAAARHLYEQKLGYKLEYTIDSAPAIRIDVAAGCFIESEASTLVLAKTISLGSI